MERKKREKYNDPLDLSSILRKVGMDGQTDDHCYCVFTLWIKNIIWFVTHRKVLCFFVMARVKRYTKNKWNNKTGVVNDPLGQPTDFEDLFVLLYVEYWWRTDDMCEYRSQPTVTVGRPSGSKTDVEKGAESKLIFHYFECKNKSSKEFAQ